MPRKQRFKPSRKPKPDSTTIQPTNIEQTGALASATPVRTDDIRDQNDADRIETDGNDHHRA